MLSYLIEDIQSGDMQKLEDRLQEMRLQGGLAGVYKLPVPQAMLNKEQREHQDSCGPFYMALETGEGRVKLEFLVRCEEKIRCSCIGYASPQLRVHMMDYLNGLLEEFKISS